MRKPVFNDCSSQRNRRRLRFRPKVSPAAQKTNRRRHKLRDKAYRQCRLVKYHNDYAEHHESPTITAKVLPKQSESHAIVTNLSQREECQKTTSPVALDLGFSATVLKPKRPPVHDFHRILTQQSKQHQYEQYHYLSRTDIFALLESFDFLDPWICSYIGQYAETTYPLYDHPVDIPPFWCASYQRRNGDFECRAIPVRLVKSQRREYKNAQGIIFEWSQSKRKFRVIFQGNGLGMGRTLMVSPSDLEVDTKYGPATLMQVGLSGDFYVVSGNEVLAKWNIVRYVERYSLSLREFSVLRAHP